MPTHLIIHPECPTCNVPMTLKSSQYGFFLGCSRWPKCRLTHHLPDDFVVHVGVPEFPEDDVVRSVEFANPNHWSEMRGEIEAKVLSILGDVKVKGVIPLWTEVLQQMDVRDLLLVNLKDILQWMVKDKLIHTVGNGMSQKWVFGPPDGPKQKWDNIPLPERWEAVLGIVKANKGIQLGVLAIEVMAHLDLLPSHQIRKQVREVLEILEEQGLVRHQGRGRNPRWHA